MPVSDQQQDRPDAQLVPMVCWDPRHQSSCPMPCAACVIECDPKYLRPAERP